MLYDAVCETSSAPGSATTINLDGAAVGFVGFALDVPTGTQVCFELDSGTGLREICIGTFTAGSPDTLSRDTVLWTSTQGRAAPTRQNFTGLTYVFSALPSDRAVFAGADGTVKLNGAPLDLGAPGKLLANAVSVLRGHLAGFITQNDFATPNTKIDIFAGVAEDEANQAGLIVSGNSLTIDATTNGAGGLDGGSLAANTWYHVHVIGKPNGTPAGLLSTNPSAPTMPSGYSLRRRVASVKTDGSAHFLPYTQVGDEFLWAGNVGDVVNDTALSNSVKHYTLASQPLGVQVRARVRCYAYNTAAVAGFCFGSLDENLGAFNLVNQVANGLGAAELLIRTNTAQQIAALADHASDNVVSIYSVGWIDTRGRLN